MKKVSVKRSKATFITVGLCLILTLIFITGCQDQETEGKPKEETSDENEISEGSNEKEDKKEDEEDNSEPEIDYQNVEPNELGEIMILMYHRIGDEEDTWERTRENFREDLERLYEKDYRIVNLMDIVEGNIDLPPGKTPVVLTFDDGTSGHFGYKENEDGEKIIDPDTAVGIILEMKEKYEDFTVGGTFYVNYLPTPFKSQDKYEEKIIHLDELGFEIGNHGYNHQDLKKISEDNSKEEAKELIQEELGLHQKYTEEIIPNYQVKSLALAFGQWPQGDKLKEYVYSGEHNDTSYEHKAVLNVGWKPSKSPFHKGFDSLDLPRIRADQARIDKWLSHYENRPEDRYVSDGNNNTISIPEEKEDYLNEEFLDEINKEINLYSIEKD
ncbi:polysaccharide deacetylase family protein [Natranaerobius trueperi]|uniref:NodB homology domain-containing protein n=1 Tax=Natranaerobius trueperi TaxID=759412 RepID=A0A226C2Y2_9FIRM|nr:polysaccharide deacetylase family protein [Natranaerobius trueperi]OWZ84767.1 hypothetical protein CDO51_01740 [Natranaerobius trueperi]